MTVVDRTREWINSLDNYVMFGTHFAPDVPSTRQYTDATAPELPTRQDWDPNHNGLSGMLGNFYRLRNTIQLFQAGESDSLFRKSLQLLPDETNERRYRLSEGNFTAHGHLYMLEASPASPPFSENLKRFVVYVPSFYTRTGDAGHAAWVHFTPVWGRQHAQSPRARAVQQYYPNSVWVHKYIADYLLGHRLLASYASASVNAVFILPVHRFSVGNALEPLGNLHRMLQMLRDIFAVLETLEPRLRARNSANIGNIQAIGASCFSFGGQYCTNVFRARGVQIADFDKLRAGAFLDGVTSNVREACQSFVGRDSSAWFSRLIPSTNDIPKRFILFQQRNGSMHPDFIEMFPRIAGNHAVIRGGSATTSRVGFNRGSTLDVPIAPGLWRNSARFHYIHTEDMGCASHESRCGDVSHRNDFFFWHGHIHMLFAEDSFRFCRDAFER